eukprot:148365-Alexandrium_andersonii.AAC.1
MSASLVGSEMCIRDRGTTSGQKASGARAWKRGAATFADSEPCRGPFGPCLLYTSDAADDM